MEKINVVQHMNEFRNILSYATNIGFFFGAGTSCAFGLPNVNELTTEVKLHLDPSKQTLFAKIESSVKDICGKSNTNVEDILNHIRMISDITQGKAKYSFNGIPGDEAVQLDEAICKSIFHIIREKEKIADISDIRRFIAWYDAANRGFTKEVYTTNYDMLLEMAMEANYTPYFDGFVGSYEPFFSPDGISIFPCENDSTNKWIRLWKIHGSLNWIIKETTTHSAERIIRVGKIDSPDKKLMIYPSREKYSLSRKEPFIAYLDRMKQYMQNGELVFICSGFSFCDQHINDIIFNAMRQNKRLYVMVFCFTDGQVDEMASFTSSHMNLCVMGPTKMITCGIERIWEYDNSKDNDEAYKLYWDEAINKFKLGDFRNMIEFLIENSGRKTLIEEMINAK